MATQAILPHTIQKTMTNQAKLKGTTLIETLVYLGLLGIMMAGLFGSTFSILQNSGRTQTKAMVQEEGNFLLAKLNWALTGGTALTVVAVPPSLTLNRANNPTLVEFALNGDSLEIKRNGSPTGDNLNNSNTKVTNLNFTHVCSGSDPESVTASFTLETKTPTGQIYSQDFVTTKYLRK